MAGNEKVVRMFHAALDEAKDGVISLRGVLDPETLVNLKTDDYQREALAPTASLQRSLVEAYSKGGRPPDIVLGMRGERYRNTGDKYSLLDDVYIIDGLQRVTGAKNYLSMFDSATVNLGATLLFDSTKDAEREMFRILNMDRLRVSASKLLSNMREDSNAVLMLYGLSNSTKTFPLYERVTWDQKMKKADLVPALTLARVTCSLHSHRSAGSRDSVKRIAEQLDRQASVVGLQVLRENTVTFFNVLEECWGVKNITYRDSAPQVKSTFMTILAKLMSDHLDFWSAKDEKRLFLDVVMRKKLAQFNLQDPTVRSFAAAGGRGRMVLYNMIRDHINSNKKKYRLRPRNPDDTPDFDDVEDAA